MVGNFHLLQDCGTIVGDCDVAVGRDEDLVKPTGTQRRLDYIRYCSGSKNMILDSFGTMLALLLALAVRKGLAANILWEVMAIFG